jgi:hypothetical protein
MYVLHASGLTGSMTSVVELVLGCPKNDQTTEVRALPAEGEPFERVVGVHIPYYATASFDYRSDDTRIREGG